MKIKEMNTQNTDNIQYAVTLINHQPDKTFTDRGSNISNISYTMFNHVQVAR